MTTAVAPTWRRARFWVGISLLILAGAVVVSLLSQSPTRPLDPASPAKDGSLALARLLGERGATVHRVTSLDAVTGTVLVAFPDSYAPSQLRDLAGTHRVVLVDPSTGTLTSLEPSLQIHDVDTDASTVTPGCTRPGPRAAGPVRFPSGTSVFNETECYGGRVIVRDRLVVFGANSLLRNDYLTRNGVAALDLNAITADGTVRDIAWLLPGQDARGTGGASLWVLLPSWAPRATVWTLLIGLLVVLWRSRRLGPVVEEPLPVVVRAAEIVEGHGRLYRRAGARDRAAATLRAGARRRLLVRLGLPRGAPTDAVVAAMPGFPPARVRDLLDGAEPGDDAALVGLAAALDDLVHSTRPDQSEGKQT